MNKPFRIIIVADKDFSNYELLQEACDKSLFLLKSVEVILRSEKDVDLLAEKYALNRNHSIKKFSAIWGRYGRNAGYKRNQQMVRYADGLIAFWDGYDKNTYRMITLAKSHGIEVKTIRY